MNIEVVIAHFDEEEKFDANFLTMVDAIASLNFNIVIVSTCEQITNLEDLPEFVKVVIRPNLGYDFYSYRVGLYLLSENRQAEKVLLINSSFFLRDTQLFKRSIMQMISLLDRNDAVGLTASKEISYHLQSHLIGLNAHLLEEDWFREWLSGIRTLSSKFEVIQKYEIGLSSLLESHNQRIASVFQLRRYEKIVVLGRYVFHKLTRKSIIDLIYDPTLTKFNPSQFAFDFLLSRHGIVKREVVLKNPHRIRKDLVDSLKIQVHKEINNSRPQKFQHDLPDQDNWQLSRAEYIRSGKPRIAVVLHLHYPELIDEMAIRLEVIAEPFDLFITTSNEAVVTVAFDVFSRVANSIFVYFVPNRGRDVAPFVHLYRSGQLSKYTSILKIHGKKSLYSHHGAIWRNRILSQLLASSQRVQEIADLLKMSTVGIIGPEREFISDVKHWGSNADTSRILMQKLDLNPIEFNELGFFAGSMFWFNPASLAKLNLYTDDDLDFEEESGQIDGTLAHAFERIFFSISKQSGFMNFGTNNLVDEIEVESNNNFIPTLTHSLEKKNDD